MSTPDTGGAADATSHRGRNRRRIWSALLGVALAAVLGIVLALTTGSSAPAVPSSFSNPFDHVVPNTVATIPLVNEHGQVEPLSSFRGRVVVLADFLTSCQEECPISTGAFASVEQSLAADGLASKVAIVEVTVDPGRDSPARLEAYEKYTGVDWTLLTGTKSQIAAFWKYFGASYSVVPDGPGDTDAIDWETGKRYTYDVDHSNLVYLLDATGHARLLTAGLPNLHGALGPKLRSLLDPLGESDLKHPGFSAWTEADLRNAIGWLLGLQVPAGS